ncbi:hypothetical protein, partial [Exiguobacterium sp. SH5S13]|uniref:hypothetical protein n=1 Tax=Exiguobacterium sp. SH5S13 TaxID=2510959 RepID=UPI001F2CA526
EYVDDKRITSLPIIDAEVYNYARIVCLRDRLSSRMISAFLNVTKSLKRNTQTPKDPLSM